MESPLFVVGMPRSGTTLLSAMLSAHSQVAITPETHFYTRCRGGAPLDDTVDAVWARLRQQPGVQDMDLTDEELRQVRPEGTNAPAMPADLLSALGRTYAARQNAAIWGEKTPDHLAHVPEILRDFPTAAVLCIVRDPRDVCLSLRSVPWNRDALPEAAWTWRRYAKASEQYQRAFPDRFREVRYEDILDAPEDTLRAVLSWLDIPFEERVLAFHEAGGDPADPSREPWKAKAQRPLDPSNKEKWATQMTAAERAVVEWIVGPALRAKGYPRSPVTVDAAFIRDLVRLFAQTARTIAGRWWRRWRTPARKPRDHTPAWMRRQEAGKTELS